MESNTPKIALDLDGSRASIRPLSYLGNFFSIYKRTCDVNGARSVKDANGQWQQVCKLDQLPALVQALRDNAFVPVMTERLVEATREKGAANQAATEVAEARLADAEARLQGTGLALYPFQREGVRWLAPREAALLADEQGLGKTVQLLLAAPAGAAVLAVVPAIVKGNWIREARRWRPDLRPVMLSGRGSFRWPRQFKVCKCDLGKLALQHQVGLDGNQQGADVVAGVQSPSELREGPANRGVEHGRANVVQATELQQPVDQRSPRVVNDHAPGTAALGNADDRAFAVDDSGQVRLFGDVRGGAEAGRRPLPGGDLEAATTERDTQPVAAHPDCPGGGAKAGSASNRFCGSCKGILWNPGTATTGNHRPDVVGEIIIVNYDILPDCAIEGREHVLPATLGKPLPGTILLVDEIHKAKNRKVKRTTALKAIRKAVAAAGAGARAWGASGTPLLNRQSELWNVLDVLGLAQDAFSSWKNFLRIAGGYEGRFGIEWTSNVDEAAMQASFRRVGLRRIVDETVDLPPKVYRDVPVEIDAATRKVCDQLVAKLAAQGIDFANATQDALSGGAAFEELSRVRAALATSKIPALLDLVEEFEEVGEPLIVFSAHRAPVEALGEREGWATILGGLDAQRRTDIVADFEAGKLKGVALTIGAGAEGITLNAARRMLFVDLAWTPALNAQAEARFRRIGQKASTLFVDRLVADHEVDTRVLELLTWKDEVIAKAVEAGRVDGRQALPEQGAAAIANALDGVEVVAEVEDAQSVEQRLRAEREAAWKRERAEREARWAAERAEREARWAAERAERQAKRDALNARDRERRENEQAPKRAAANEVEEWASRAVLTLSALDPDRAAIENAAGWSASDGGDGHRLAKVLLATGGQLTDRDWKLAASICGKYWRQVGRRPEAKNDGAAA